MPHKSGGVPARLCNRQNRSCWSTTGRDSHSCSCPSTSGRRAGLVDIYRFLGVSAYWFSGRRRPERELNLRRAGKFIAFLFAGSALACVVLLALATPIYAAEDSQSGFTIIVSEVRSITIDSSSADFSPGAMELISGWTRESSSNLIISSNTEWVLSIRGTSPTWDGPWLKPVGDIFWSYNGGKYVPLSVDSTEILHGGAADHRPYALNFKVHLDPLKDIPGEYRYQSIVLELTSP